MPDRINYPDLQVEKYIGHKKTHDEQYFSHNKGGSNLVHPVVYTWLFAMNKSFPTGGQSLQKVSPAIA